MKSSDEYFKRSKGAKLINTAYNYTKQTGVILLLVDRSTDLGKDIADKILTISTDSNTTEINFNREVIKNYPGCMGAENNRL